MVKGVGRSELAADYYDEILFKGATFGDLVKHPGPLVVASSTDISTGARLAFSQNDFDIICSDLAGVKLSRAAAASSAVPVVLSPLAFNNYGGSCSYEYPAWVDSTGKDGRIVSGRLQQRYREMRSFQDSAKRPYLHLVDGGVADNLGLRAVLERFRAAEASPEFRKSLNIHRLKRTLLIIVNSRSDPELNWDQSEDGPSAVALLLKSVSVPIDRNSFEAVELMKDLLDKWKQTRERGRQEQSADDGGPQRIRLYPVVVSFEGVQDPQLRARLMALPTTFSLPDRDVDLLRKVAGDLLRSSPEFIDFVQDLREH
nr:patatin-like phospholipase family protein [Paucibacter sp. M5-1]MCZ7880416.1 patatin-like phospholipase family protein [Paucibacter sp. M5-1]